LDKSTQSKERGMTLDLGFSCFFVDLPPQFRETYPHKEQLQVTLVDCPGHASLIRTIIGGAQIIDMVLLVVDAQKGWQAQTTECLVLAELTSPHLVVALNKADLLASGSDDSDGEREARIQRSKRKVRERLSSTRFADAPIVAVAACVGGEKVAAVSLASSAGATAALASSPLAADPALVSVIPKNETFNMDRLVKVLKEKLPPPKRVATGPFYFSIDHCFSLRGRGTVLTGTVLSGTASVNDVLEFPALALDRKIKSMQMFKRQVPSVQQGDRAGICVPNLDAKLIERGIAASPGVVTLWKAAIALVRKVKYYPGTLPCGSKFHISVGHSTVMATVSFWGARELHHQQQDLLAPASGADVAQEASLRSGSAEAETSSSTAPKSANKKGDNALQSSSLGGGADLAGLPRLPFDFDQSFVHQDSLLESLDSSASADGSEGASAPKGDPLLHWALIEFQTPVHCPVHSLAIGSRLDTVDGNASGSVSSCRLAFSARLIVGVDPDVDLARLRIYTPKERRGVVSRLGEPHKRQDDGKVVRYEVFGSDLFKKETNMKPFIGMKIETVREDVGTCTCRDLRLQHHVILYRMGMGSHAALYRCGTSQGRSSRRSVRLASSARPFLPGSTCAKGSLCCCGSKGTRTTP
jgi:selenocysteine-specific elongation factor